MLLRITRYSDVDERKLMEVYSESNYENTEYFFPEETDKNTAVRQVEAGFLDFLKNEFFKAPDASVWVWEENGSWLCALRTCRVRPGLHYLEALETRPDQRRKGYASLLLANVEEALKKEGSFRLCDCVSKKNTAAVKVHEKCGFRIVSEEGYDYLQEEINNHDFGFEYCYSGA